MTLPESALEVETFAVGEDRQTPKEPKAKLKPPTDKEIKQAILKSFKGRREYLPANNNKQGTLDEKKQTRIFGADYKYLPPNHDDKLTVVHDKEKQTTFILHSGPFGVFKICEMPWTKAEDSK